MNQLSPNTLRLADGLLTEGAVTMGVGEVVLGDGRSSIVDINVSDVISSPNLFVQIASAYKVTLAGSGMIDRELPGHQFLAATPSQVPYTGAIGARFSLGLLRRKEQLNLAGPRAIAGVFAPNDEVILLSGVLSPGSGLPQEIEDYQSAGLRVKGVVALIDRQQGERTKLAGMGITSVAAMTLSGIARRAYEKELGGVTDEIYGRVMDELDPAERAT